MNSLTQPKSPFAGILAVAGVLGLAALLTASARATIIYSEPEALPTMTPTNTNFYAEVSAAEGGGYGSNPNNPSEVDLGLFTFSDPSAVSTLEGLSISLTLNQLNTALPTVRNPNGGEYLNDIDLTINGIDTGIPLNGFPSGQGQNTVTGIVNLTADQQTQLYDAFQGDIGATQYTYYLPTASGGSVVSSGSTYAALGGDLAETNDAPVFTSAATTAGQLVVGLVLVNQDTNPAVQGNPLEFQEVGGAASLAVADTPIPFEPSQALGFGLIALFIALWYVPQTKEMMKRMLIPAGA